MIEIFQATESHLDSLVELVNFAYRGEGAKQGWTTEAHLLDGQRTDRGAMQEILKEPGSKIFVVVDSSNNSLLGCVNLRWQVSRCYLGMLTVDPRKQGHGVGGQLLQFSEGQAKAWGCKVMYMNVISVREELIAWYERQGYRRTNETKPFPYGNPRFGLPKMPGLEFFVLEKNL